MHPKLNQRYFLLLISLVLILYVPGSLCQNGGEYAACGAPHRCGDIQDITYPFWGESRPDYCGFPGFQLICQGGVALLNISSTLYRLLEINYTTQTLQVAREDLSNTICPRFLYNTTLNLSLFTLSPDYRNVTVYYGCSFNGQPIQSPNQFNCNVNGTDTENFYVIGEATDPGSIRCNNNINVPINQSLLALPTASVARLLQDAFARGFSLQWEANNRICRNCIGSGGLCGTNRNSGSFACYCADRTSALTCNDAQTGNAAGRIKLKLILFAGVSAAAVVLISIILFIFNRRKCMLKLKGKTQNHKDIELFLKNNEKLTPRRYNYSDLKKMTNSFSDNLGKGGFASVYRGKLPDGRLVAVKILKESKGNGEEFINEVSSISRTSHVNVVTLLGFCFEGSKRALIYEFMPNGSLEKFICSNVSKAKCQLGWEQLFQIAVGIAKGIEYLHQGCITRILHFDIKPHNILLDKDFIPKLSDFGLAKLCPNRSSIVSMLGARGTIGYIAPEIVCRNVGVISYKSDVYSYGMMVLEMVEETKNTNVKVDHSSEKYFPHWIYKHLEQNFELDFNGVVNEDELLKRKMVIVGLWCIQTDTTTRPSMSRVIEMLEGNMESLQIPPKPYFLQPRAAENFSTTESSVTLS